MTRQAVSVVIPTYQRRKLLQRHLPDVFAALADGDEVVIVEDHGGDDSVEWLKQAFQLEETLVIPEPDDLPLQYYPAVSTLQLRVLFGKVPVLDKLLRMVVLETPENFRFAGAANTGVALASEELVFLLNNDVSPAPNCVDVLAPHFSEKNVFGVGCLEYEDELGGEQSGKNKLWFEKGLFVHSKADNFDFGETAWVSGGSGMFSRNKWLRLGGFDQAFLPAYWEDVDLSYRAQKNGWKTLFEPDAIVLHQHETTNKVEFGDDAIDTLSWNSIQVFTKKHTSLLQKLQYYLWKPYWWWKRRRFINKNK